MSAVVLTRMKETTLGKFYAHLLLKARRADQRLLAFLFHGGHLLLQVGHEFLLLPCHVGWHSVLEGLAGPGQLFLEVVAPLHQRAQFGLRGLAGRRGLGPQRGAVGGEHGGVYGIVLGPLPLGQGEVADERGVDDTHGLPAACSAATTPFS